MSQARGYAVKSPTSPLEPFSFERREPRDHDVQIEIAYCGICHSDIHQARNEWSNSTYPMVPGHEIVGKVTKVGAKASKFRVGDTAAVGCMVDTCRRCPNCKQGLEQHCLLHISLTYNGTEQDAKTPTYGGYSTHIVVDEGYAFKVPPKLPLERVAPLLCAGITTYSPLRRWKIGKGSRVGVMGLGGLGHMAVKNAAALGAEVVVFSRSKAKEADAKRLGAQELVVSGDAQAAKRLAGRLDLIIDTISADHGVEEPLAFLKTAGTLVLVGAPPKPLAVSAFSLIGGRKNISGSVIGGVAETQEMLDFCGERNVVSDVEVVGVKDIDKAYERTLKGDVRYRFVVDLKTLR